MIAFLTAASIYTHPHHIPPPRPPQPPLAAANDPESREIQQLAATIQGEASPLALGDEAAIALAWTVRNRRDNDPQRRPLAYHLTAYTARRTPTPAALRIAREVLSADRADDPTGGRTYALSRDDIFGFFECSARTARRLDAIVYRAHGMELWIARHYPGRVCSEEAGK